MMSNNMWTNASDNSFRPGEDESVRNARSRFKNLIQEATHRKSSFMEYPEYFDDFNTLNSVLKEKVTPKKPETTGTLKAQTTFVMKLFDRSVELAQFRRNTSLYPMCREWFKNKPYSSRTDSKTQEEEEEEAAEVATEGSAEVFKLPPPDPLPRDMYGDEIGFRVPTPLPRGNTEPLIIYKEDDMMLPNPTMLFQNHLDRWNLTKLRWREAGLFNEYRYRESFKVIRSCYDKDAMKNLNSNPVNYYKK